MATITIEESIDTIVEAVNYSKVGNVQATAKHKIKRSL